MDFGFLQRRLTDSLESTTTQQRKAGKPSEALVAHRESIRRVVASHRTRNPRVFGSVLHGDDTDGSNLDILIDPTDETSLFDLGAIQYELNVLLGVPVDIVTPMPCVHGLAKW